jgi:hypothetical protein
VVARSRRLLATVALVLVASWPRDGAAAPSQTLIDPERQSYQVPLAASYVLAPLLALGVGGGLSKLTNNDTLAVVGGGLMFFAPATVHIIHGNGGHGLASFPELLALTALSVFLAGGVGYIIGAAGCTSDGEECDFAGFEGMIYGALLGGVTAYTSYAIYDVSANAFVVHERRDDARGSIRFWLSPVGTARRGVARVPNAWTGFQLGATLGF